jgi:hypothetical protein
MNEKFGKLKNQLEKDLKVIFGCKKEIYQH